MILNVQNLQNDMMRTVGVGEAKSLRTYSEYDSAILRSEGELSAYIVGDVSVRGRAHLQHRPLWPLQWGTIWMPW